MIHRELELKSKKLHWLLFRITKTFTEIEKIKGKLKSALTRTLIEIEKNQDFVFRLQISNIIWIVVLLYYRNWDLRGKFELENFF